MVYLSLSCFSVLLVCCLPNQVKGFTFFFHFQFFMDDCLQRLIDLIEAGEGLKNLILRERIYKLVRARLELQAPFISKWAQALSIQVSFSVPSTLSHL